MDLYIPLTAYVQTVQQNFRNCLSIDHCLSIWNYDNLAGFQCHFWDKYLIRYVYEAVTPVTIYVWYSAT